MAPGLRSLNITSVRIPEHRDQDVKMVTDPYLNSPVIPPLQEKFSIGDKCVQNAKKRVKVIPTVRCEVPSRELI